MKFGADQKPRDSGGEEYSFSDCEAIAYLYNAQAPQTWAHYIICHLFRWHIHKRPGSSAPGALYKIPALGWYFLFLASYFFRFVEMDTSGKFPELVDHESCSSEYEWT